MNQPLYSAALRSLHGMHTGMLRSAWRRSAALAGPPTVDGKRRPNRRRVLVAAARRAIVPGLLACAIGLGVSPLLAGASRGAPEPADAMQALLAHRHATAYGRFVQQADQGHVPSALMALVMVCHGASVFGSDWSATAGQLQRWSAMTGHDPGPCARWVPEHDRGE